MQARIGTVQKKPRARRKKYVYQARVPRNEHLVSTSSRKDANHWPVARRTKVRPVASERVAKGQGHGCRGGQRLTLFPPSAGHEGRIRERGRWKVCSRHSRPLGDETDCGSRRFRDFDSVAGYTPMMGGPARVALSCPSLGNAGTGATGQRCRVRGRYHCRGASWERH